jgi:hypothetical protein
MRYRTGEAARRVDLTREEIILEGWLEESGPYVSLRDTKGLKRHESQIWDWPVVRPEAAEA